jgi:septal ring factor EnvC (AmiA/AmiB activator)
VESPLILTEETRRLGLVAMFAAVLFAAGFCASWLVGSVDPTYRLGRLETSMDLQQRTLNAAAIKLDVAISRLEDVSARIAEMAAQMREAEQRLTKLELKIAALDAELRADEGALEARGFLNHPRPQHSGTGF